MRRGQWCQKTGGVVSAAGVVCGTRVAKWKEGSTAITLCRLRRGVMMDDCQGWAWTQLAHRSSFLARQYFTAQRHSLSLPLDLAFSIGWAGALS